MEMTQKPTLFSDRLAWGVTLLAVSMLIEVIVTVYGLTNINVQFDPDMMSSPTISPLQTVMGCISPLITLTRVVGVVLIALGSRQIAGQQRTLAWSGFGLYILSLILGVLVIGVSMSATTRGSLSMLTLANWLSTGSSLLAYAGLVLLVFSLASSALRMSLLAALLLILVGQGGSALLTIGNMTMESYELYGQTYYFPNVNIDRTTGIWPVLSIASVAGQALFLMAFAALAVTGWRALGSALPDTVS